MKQLQFTERKHVKRGFGFTLENLSDETVYVLKWFTPLEGLFGDIFRITRDSEEIPYTGPMVKRGDPVG